LVSGHDTRKHPVAALARWAGLVFQDPEAQLTQMCVEDEIAFGPENLGLPPTTIDERVAWALATVGLAAHRDRSPLHLSGGEKQRVAIAALLAMQPEALVLDDPTANLDPAGKSAIFDALITLARRQKLAVLVATQDLELVNRYADRVLVLHEGRIGLDGPPHQVFAQVARLQEWGAGLPQLAELAAMLGRRMGRSFHFRDIGQAYAQIKPLLPTINQGARPAPARSCTSKPLISLHGATYTYLDGATALQAVDLTLDAGEFVALVGPNGSGKTTLAKLLNGLLRPTQGQVIVAGRDTRAARVPELARIIGYVFQNPDHQLFAATVAEEVAFGPRLQGLPQAEVARRVADALDRFRLTGHAHLPPALLGSSQRRQVSLAAVLATQPRALVLDEPGGGLDHRSLQELMAAVSEFHHRGGTVLLITHDMRLVAEYATRAVVLLGGQVLFDGAPRDLFSDHSVVAQACLAVPPVIRLTQRLAAHGFDPNVLTNAEFVAAWSRHATSETRHAG